MNTSDSSAGEHSLLGKMLGALGIAAAPFIAYPLGLFAVFDSVAVFLIAFAICGLSAGSWFGFVAIAAGVVTYPIAIGVLDYAGFIGWSDDSVFVALFGLLGSGLFCVTALVGAALRILVIRGRGVSDAAKS